MLFIHGLGNTGDAWKEVIQRLPDDVHAITIDLSGFGNSQKHRRATYDARTQAKSVLMTLIKLRPKTPLIIVGHSLGALVAIEIAKRYKPLVKHLVLCSPPLYDVHEVNEKVRTLDRLLRRAYRGMLKHPEEFMRLTAFATKYGLVNHSFNVTADNVDSFMASLQGAILNQTALEDIKHIRSQAHIIRGRFDPLVVHANLRDLANKHDHITLDTINAGHDVRGSFVSKVVEQLDESLTP